MSTKEQLVVLHLSDLHFGWEGDEKGRTAAFVISRCITLTQARFDLLGEKY
jgi:hypothetical protein